MSAPAQDAALHALCEQLQKTTNKPKSQDYSSATANCWIARTAACRKMCQNHYVFQLEASKQPTPLPTSSGPF
ncbi:hypothetical protein [Acidithiobacillus sp.]